MKKSLLFLLVVLTGALNAQNNLDTDESLIVHVPFDGNIM